MAKKSNFIKNLLTTASAVAVLAGGVESAFAVAAPVRQTTGNATFQDGGVIANLNPVGNWAPGSAIKIGANGHTLTTTGAATVSLIDLDGKNPGLLTAAHALSLGAVTNGGGNHLDLTMANVVVTLTGIDGGLRPASVNDYSGLENILVGTAAGGGTLNINLTGNGPNQKKSTTLTGTIDSHGGATNGKITVQAGNEVKFDGVIGGTDALESLELVGASVAILNANARFNHGGADTIKMGAGSTLNVTGPRTLTFAGVGDSLDGAAAGNGKVVINAGGAANLVTFTDVAIGANTAIDSVTIENGKFKTNAPIKATNGVILGNGGVLTVNGANLVITSSAANKGIIGDGTGNSGSVSIESGHNLTVEGSLGTKDEAIAGITIADAAGASNILIQDVGGAANFLTTRNGITWTGNAGNGGILHSKSANLTINSNVGTAAKKLTEVKIDQLAAGGAAGKVTLGEGKKIYAVDIKLTANQANELHLAKNAEVHGTVGIDHAAGTLKFAGEGSKVVGNIIGTTANRGIVEVVEDSSVTGQIGTAANAIDILKFTVADKTLTVNAGGAAGLIKANTGIQFEADGTLALTGNQDHVIESKITVGAGAADGKGKILIAKEVGDKTITFKNQIGDQAVDNASLKELRSEGNAKIIFSDDTNVHIKSLVLNGNGKVTLSKDTGNYRFGGITTKDGQNTLEINAATINLTNVAAGTAVNFGAADAALDKLSFTGNHTLNVADGINIYAKTLETNAAGEGLIEFQGSSILSAKKGQNAFGDIKASGVADKTLQLKGEFELAAGGVAPAVRDGKLLIGAGTVTIDSNFKAVGIEAINAGAGNLKFVNPEAIHVEAPIADDLASVEFNGNGNTKFVGAFGYAKELKFTGNEATTVEFGDANTNIGDNVITSKSAEAHTIVISNASTTFTKAVGAANTPINIKLKGDIKAIAESAANPDSSLVGVTFLTTKDNEGELVINKDATKIRGVGAKDAKYKLLTISANGEITNDVYATTITVADDKKAIFGGMVSGNELQLTGISSQVEFGDKAILDTNLLNTSGTDKKGIATFKGSTTLYKDIGKDDARLASTIFDKDGATINLHKDIYSDKIGFAGEGQKVNVNAQVTLNGEATLNGSTVNLKENKLSTPDGLVMKGDMTITTSITHDNANNLIGGKIKSTGALTTTDLNGLTIQVDGSARLKSASGKFALLDNTEGSLTGNAFDGAKINVNSEDTSFSAWALENGEKGSLYLKQQDNTTQGVANRFKKAGVAMSAADQINVELLKKATGDGEKIIDAMNDMDSAQTVETLQRLIANEVNQELENTLGDASTSVAGRLYVNNPGNLGEVPVETASNGDVYSGISAGEDVGRYGVWANPFFANGTQKARKGTAGYKSERYGASIGFDVKANDNMLIGAAMTYLNTNVKHKNHKVGDTTKIDSLLFSIYGMQQFTDNWFGQGIVTFGSNKVKNTETRRLTKDLTKKAFGKYNSTSFGGEVMAGYNTYVDQFTLTPMAGLKFTRVNDGGYRETGADYENLSVNKKASNKFEIVAGVRASARAFDLNGMSVSPEVHAFVNHDLIGKNPNIEMKLNGVEPLANNKAKPARTNYTLGAGLNAGYGMMDYGVCYDANIANKYLGHQGSIKVRVNF